MVILSLTRGERLFKGEITEFQLYNAGQSGQIGTASIEEFAKITDILKKGGEITVIMTYNKYGRSDYRFKLNVDGFENAITLIQ